MRRPAPPASSHAGARRWLSAPRRTLALLWPAFLAPSGEPSFNNWLPLNTALPPHAFLSSRSNSKTIAVGLLCALAAAGLAVRLKMLAAHTKLPFLSRRAKRERAPLTSRRTLFWFRDRRLRSSTLWPSRHVHAGSRPASLQRCAEAPSRLPGRASPLRSASSSSPRSATKPSGWPACWP